MKVTRLSNAGRRASIVAAAKVVFARYGLEGARTQQIAKAAGVSEALLFRHFPNKTQIYRAVLRGIIAEQDAAFRALGTIEPSTDGLLAMIHRVFVHVMTGQGAGNVEGIRMVVGSLVGDGAYARLIYRRALRLGAPNLAQAMAAAKADGGLTGAMLAPSTAAAFLEHVATMVLLAQYHDRPAIPYGDDEQSVIRDAVLFCARGLGIAESRIEVFLKRNGA